MDTNLNQLRIFHSVAKNRSFTRAADELCLTQPGVSKHIRQLESHYNVKLFDRLAKEVALTQAGELLFQTTQNVFQLLEDAEARIQELTGAVGGKLTIGASVTMGICFLPAILRTFTTRYPGVEISLTIDLSRQVEERVLRNSIDLGLIGAPSNDRRLVAVPFLTDRLIVIVPPGHKWESRVSVTPEEVAEARVVVSGAGSGTRAFLEDRFGSMGLTFASTLEFGNTEGVKRAVEHGLGISIISTRMVEREVSAGLLVGLSLDGLNLERKFSYVYRRGKNLTAAAQRFLELL